MNSLSKPFYFKLLVFAIFAFVFISAPIYAQEDESYTLFNKSKKDESSKKTMKSRSWNNSKSEEKTEEVTEDTTEVKEKAEEEIELTEDQKLWKKYKDLAEGNGIIPEENEDKTSIEDIEKTENNDDIKTKEEGKTEEKESSVGIQAIMENYKKSQEKKGKMHSRSFGKLD